MQMALRGGAQFMALATFFYNSIMNDIMFQKPPPPLAKMIFQKNKKIKNSKTHKEKKYCEMSVFFIYWKLSKPG